ncbi:MAG: calcium-translocating P-type ATPase, PMCA-type [Clostridiales bacterium]|nr:calcium-translocating P-type ATPase, PMCA-type [Clostridiales bacterium]
MPNIPFYNSNGLTAEEVLLSRQKYGSNQLAQKNKNSFLKQFALSFGDPIIKILLIALAVNFIFMLRDFNWYETVGIAVAVLLATFVSTLSEYGSESAFEKLQEEAANIKCRVKRGGVITEISIGEIVSGDIILLSAGERVPADGFLTRGSLTVDQSVLNGETKEARKQPGEWDFGSDELMTKGKLFKGTVVCSGEGIMVAERVGENTFYGKIACEVQADKAQSPLKERLGDLARTISVFGYAAAVVVVIANLFNTIVLDNNFNTRLITAYLADTPRLISDFLRAVTLGITVIVMAVPEGLPMMITVVLSANMRKMLKDNVLVRKLVGIETSGSLNILFTDKTGTLTKGKLEVTRFLSGTGRETDLRTLKNYPKLLEKVRMSCFYNNAAQMGVRNGKKQIVGGNSTDRALFEFAVSNGKIAPSCEKKYTEPFNSEVKYSITEIGGAENAFLLKGAPEVFIKGCVNTVNEYGETVPFNPLAVSEKLAEMAADSFRLLALATAKTKNDAVNKQRLTLIGFLGLKDEIRPECIKAVKDCTSAGIQVVMVTGDNRETAVSVAKHLGLIGKRYNREVLTAAELAEKTDDEVKKLLPDIRVIARALPSDKSRLIKLAQENSLVAGMTGDGVNDAPALKKADVGFAMGSGAEIAKEAGDIVILDNNFASIVKAVLYGRTIFKSIRKFLIFQLSINLCAVGVSVIGPFIGIETPVTVIQMLWINIIMDTLAGLAYAGEAPLAEYMREAPKKRNEKIINKYMYSQIICSGLYTTALCLLFFKLPAIHAAFRSDDEYMLTAFFALFIFAGVFNSLSARTYRINLLSYIRKNKAFILIMGMVAAVQIILIYYGGKIFRTAGLTANELLFVILLASTVVIFDLIRKIILRVNHRKGFI